MKIFLKDLETNKKYPIKGITQTQYEMGDYSEVELFDMIYKLLMKHRIVESAIVNVKGERV